MPSQSVGESLDEVVRQHPYPDYAAWWPMGETFLRFMAAALVENWRNVHRNPQPLTVVESYAAEYLATVYGRTLRPDLVSGFATGQDLANLQSGEFDALSYAFFRAAYEWIESHAATAPIEAVAEKRSFAEGVGAHFYRQLHDHLGLDLPMGLDNARQFDQLQTALQTVGDFLVAEGYLRDHFAFRFNVTAERGDQIIQQATQDALSTLHEKGLVYAVYEMGYPAILPSAVYLYHTLGEAQHHSSRTIQELFLRVGYAASETEDFDPTGYPSDLVVELWEIHPWPENNPLSG